MDMKVFTLGALKRAFVYFYFRDKASVSEARNFIVQDRFDNTE